MENVDETQASHAAVSKSQRKRESAELQTLAAKLARLAPEQLGLLHLPGDLIEELAAVRSIKKPAAYKRQIKFIGGLLRKIDTEPIYRGLDRLNGKGAEAKRLHHEAERWRDRLLAEGDVALTELVNAAFSLDSQRVRQLIREINRQISVDKPPVASRLLYRYLREQLSKN